jgi:hypothetical protein
MRVCKIEIEDQGETTGDIAASEWSPETAGDMTE